MHVISVLIRVTYVYKAAFNFKGPSKHFIIKTYIWKT